MKTISERIADFTLNLTIEQIPVNVIGYEMCIRDSPWRRSISGS